MKEVCILILFLIMADISLCISNPSLVCEEDSSQFLGYLKKNKVQVYGSPKAIQDKTLCNGFWNLEGSCCDVDSFMKFEDIQYKELAESISNSKRSIETDTLKLQHLFQKIKEIEQSKIQVEGIDRELLNILESKALDGIFYYAMDPSALEGFGVQHDKCWGSIRDSRKKLSCQFCRPFAKSISTVEKIFDANWVCPLIYKECKTTTRVTQSHLRANLLFSKTILAFPNLQKTDKELFEVAKSTYTYTKPVLETFSSFSQHYLSYTSQGTEDPNGYFCYFYYGYLRPPYITFIEDYFKVKQDLLGKILTRFQKYKTSTGASSSPPRNIDHDTASLTGHHSHTTQSRSNRIKRMIKRIFRPV